MVKNIKWKFDLVVVVGLLYVWYFFYGEDKICYFGCLVKDGIFLNWGDLGGDECVVEWYEVFWVF